jgi:inorganic pyrophosphatase
MLRRVVLRRPVVRRRPAAPAFSLVTGAPVPESDTHEIEVVVEIPRGCRNKYEFDHERHVFRLDRRLFSATSYPADYGFVPDTLAEDGDPLDALVLVEDPTFPGCYVCSRPIGVFWMTDEKGPDAKIICVPSHEPRWADTRDIHDLPEALRAEVAQFFAIYKELEPEKESEIGGYDGRGAALGEIEVSRRRFRQVTAGR